MLKARAATIGQALIKVPSGYQISRWGQTRHCTDMGQVQAVLARMGART
ncbi:MAG: hypothetical protein IPN53_17480 [Comamonadaceae bacterium]|nr:hypothetical protein [Comamonadaceae bacterium]